LLSDFGIDRFVSAYEELYVEARQMVERQQ